MQFHCHVGRYFLNPVRKPFKLLWLSSFHNMLVRNIPQWFTQKLSVPAQMNIEYRHTCEFILLPFIFISKCSTEKSNLKFSKGKSRIIIKSKSTKKTPCETKGRIMVLNENYYEHLSHCVFIKVRTLICKGILLLCNI